MTDDDTFERLETQERIDYIGRLLDADPAEARRLCASSLRLHRWVQEASLRSVNPIDDVEVEEFPGPPPLKLPTGLDQLDARLDGGLYGFAVIAANPKCGKSLLALSAGLEAARDGWRVLHFDAEHDQYERANRVRRYLGLGRIPREICECFSFHPTSAGVSLSGIARKVEERLSLDDKQLLLVFDSINRIVLQAKSSGSDAGHWAEMERWTEYLRVLAQISGRRVASIAVSELAAGGWAKGRAIEFAADVVVKIQRVDPDDERYVKISVPYARSSGGGQLGVFRVQWETGRFIHADRE